MKLSLVSVDLLCSSFVLLCLINISSCKLDDTSNQARSPLNEITLYQNLFKVKRKEHLAVVQKLILVEDIAKLASFLELTLNKIVETLSKSITALNTHDYLSGTSFPKDPTIREELSKVLENTAFFTDLIVRFPKPSHIFYKKNKNSWKKIIKAATNICEYSGVFDGEYATLLHNLKQELEIGPKDEAYSNPFSKYGEVEDHLTSEERRELYEAAKRKKRLLEKKSKRSGPKLTSHIEL